MNFDLYSFCPKEMISLCNELLANYGFCLECIWGFYSLHLDISREWKRTKRIICDKLSVKQITYSQNMDSQKWNKFENCFRYIKKTVYPPLEIFISKQCVV